MSQTEEQRKEKEKSVSRAASKKWRQNHPDYIKEWANANRDKVRAANAKWRATHPKEYAQKQITYWQKRLAKAEEAEATQ